MGDIWRSIRLFAKPSTVFMEHLGDHRKSDPFHCETLIPPSGESKSSGRDALWEIAGRRTFKRTQSVSLSNLNPSKEERSGENSGRRWESSWRAAHCVITFSTLRRVSALCEHWESYRRMICLILKPCQIPPIPGN